MKKSILRLIIHAIVFLIFLQSPLNVYGMMEKETTIDEKKLYAKAAALIDADSGRILFEKNGSEQLPMASTTKIMTLIVALENANLEDLVSVSEYAASMPDVQLNMKKGEFYRLSDLTYSLMLESHNDTAVAIAEYIGGQDGKKSSERTIEESKRAVHHFCSLMNQKARDIGCYHCSFVTPNGLDPVNDAETQIKHETTAIDLAEIMRYCIMQSSKKDQFLEITRTRNYTFSNYIIGNDGKTCNGSRNFTCHNHNAFLDMMEGALSGKTGFTGKAGYCYVGSLKRDDRTYIVALLACGWPNNKGYKWNDMKKLMNYGINNYYLYDMKQIKLNTEELKPIPILDGKTKAIGENAKIAIKCESGSTSTKNEKILLKTDEKITVSYEIPDLLNAPVEKGTILGEVVYKLNGETCRKLQIVANESVEKIDIKWCMEQIISKYFMTI